MVTQAANTTVSQWGNGLAFRINEVVAKAAGVVEGTPVRITAERGRIIVEVVQPASALAAMLAAFDPARHAGEVMVFAPVSREAM